MDDAPMPPPLCAEVDRDDSDEEDTEEQLEDEVTDIMTRFIELEEACTIPRWEPGCDSETVSEQISVAFDCEERTLQSEDNCSIPELPERPPSTPPSPTVPSMPLSSSTTPQEAHAHLDELKTQASALQADLDKSERALDALTWRDQPALKTALKGLSLKAKDKRIDVFFRTRITSMVATINLYLDENVACTWRQASVLAAKAQGRGTNHARNLRSWIHRFLSCGELPIHRYGQFHASLLEDEDFAGDLQTYLMEVATDGYVSGQHVVDFVQTDEVQK
ncbi:hypothetical protein B0H14DRAFT_3454009 [Mycena olivaceomarginata]|nr:hypothetical protein B0H14DRAFT_3454009 [Mycena olivaceomarginata]